MNDRRHFRAVHKLTKHWFDSSNLVFHDGKWFDGFRNFENYIPFDLNQIAVMEYSGVDDIKNIQIFEDDVVKNTLRNGSEDRLIGVVKFISGRYIVEGVKQYEGIQRQLERGYEILGDIYDNPELVN